MWPGILAVLNWLGADDIVSCAMAGGSYGYALMLTFVNLLGRFPIKGVRSLFHIVE